MEIPSMDNQDSYLFAGDPPSFSAELEAIFQPQWPTENEMAELSNLEVKPNNASADSIGTGVTNGVPESDFSFQECVDASFADLANVPPLQSGSGSDHSAISWNLPTEHSWDPTLFVEVNPELTGLSSISEDLIMPDWEDNFRMDVDMGFVQEVEIQSEPESPNLLFDEPFSVPEEPKRSMKLRAPGQRVNIIQRLRTEFVVDSRSSQQDIQIENVPGRRTSAEMKPRRRGIILCNDCGKCFASTTTLKKHTRNVHQQKSANNLNLAMPKEALHLASKFICTPKVVLERIPVPQMPHAKHQSRRLSFQCSLCYKKFLSNDALRSHQIRFHKMKSRTSKCKPKPLCKKLIPEKCSSCDKIFSSKQALKQHQIVVHRLKLDNYKRIMALNTTKQECFICGHKSTNIYHLRRHQKIAHKLNLPKTRTVWKQLEPESKKKFTRPSECYFNPVVVVENSQQPDLSDAEQHKSTKTIKPFNQRKKLFMLGRRKLTTTKSTKRLQRCDICNEMVDGSMTAHKVDVHNLALHNPRYKIIRQSERCRLCSKIIRKQYLNEHMQSVHGEGNQAIKRKILRGNKRSANCEDRNLPLTSRKMICKEPRQECSKFITPNSDLDESHIEWLQRRIKVADETAKMYSHILETRCVVPMMDLKHTIVRVVPQEIIATDISQPEISETTSGISNLSPADDDDTGDSLESFFSTILQEVESASPTSSTNDAGEGIAEMLDSRSDGQAPDSPSTENTLPSQEIFEVCEGLIRSVSEQSENTTTTQIPIDPQHEEATTAVIQETVRELIEATASEIELFGNNEIIESTSLTACENARVVECTDEANVESQEGTELELEHPFETVIRIDDAGQDYEYLDAVADEEARVLEVEPVPGEQMVDNALLPFELVTSPVSLPEETSDDSNQISKMANNEQLARPNAWKVSVEDIRRRKLKCGVCKEMVEVGFFERHKKTDHILECHICLKPVHLSKTRQHGATHVASLQCELCKYKAVRKSRLWEHMNSHLRIRPLFCDICGKSFAAAANLSGHYWRSHFKLRRYKCEFCSDTFVAGAHRNHHERLQHGE